MSKTSINARLAMIQSFAGFLDSGGSSAHIDFYEGLQPANTSTEADLNSKLVGLILPKPCTKEVTSSYVELHPSAIATVIKSGTVTWARIYNGAGEVAADLTVGVDITLANASIIAGGLLTISSIKIRP